MIQILFLVCVVAGYVNSAVIEKCKVGQWGDWSECRASRQCYRQPLISYAMEPTQAWDSGRESMQAVMRRKAEHWSDLARCKAAGTCPEMRMQPLAGAYRCDDSGMAGDMPCMNVDKLSFLTFKEMGYEGMNGDWNPQGNDIWGWTDSENCEEYAIMGLSGGTAFVRITDPENPVPVGFIYTQTVASSWRDIKVIGNYAYIVSEAASHGLQVFDLTRLRGWDKIQYFTPDAWNFDFGNAHNVVTNKDTNYVYVVGARKGSYKNTCKGGLMIFDVRDPLNPTFVACFGDDGYTHDAQCVIYRGPDTRYQKHEICFCFNEDSLTIVDVTNKTSMRVISKVAYKNFAYIHQGWVTDDHELLLIDDELDEEKYDSYTKTYLYDVRNLEDPQLKSVFRSAEESIDHNQYIIGNYTFQANYESGLRILHINRETETLSLVAYFDVFPSRTSVHFSGAWSVYPYFTSGTIVISSIEYGLFVVKPDWDAIEKVVKSDQVVSQQTRFRQLVAAEQDSACPSLSEARLCYAQVICQP